MEAIILSNPLSEQVFPGESKAMKDISKFKEIEKVLEENNKKLELLHSTTTSLLFEDNPKKLLDALFEKLSKHLELEVYFNYMTAEEEGNLRLANYHGIPEYVAKEIETLKFGQAVCGCVAERRNRIIAEDIQSSSDIHVELVRGFGIQAYICNPLIAYGKLIGTLSFGSRKKTCFNAEEIELITFVSEQVALSTERLKYIAELKIQNIMLENHNRQQSLHMKSFVKLFNAAPNPQSITSLSYGKIINVNKAFIELLNLKTDNLLHKQIEEIDFWCDMKQYYKLLQKTIEEDEIRNIEIFLKTSSGEIRTVLYSAVRVNYLGEECILGIYNDITEKVIYNKELERIQNLHQLSQLAAGIGHEIRNPLSYIKGNLQLLKLDPVLTDYNRKIDLMVRELDRTVSIISDFSSIGKACKPNYSLTNLNNVIQDVVSLVRYETLVTSKIIELELSEIPELLVDKNDITQLILNLVKNSLEAISESGIVTISTYIHENYVILAVKDNGPGIEPSILKKIGTPFFTTKQNGTGLGIMTCKNIAARNNSLIEIESTELGTIFYVKFSKS
jgi:PAS domain S-box-containing protein